VEGGGETLIGRAGGWIDGRGGRHGSGSGKGEGKGAAQGGLERPAVEAARERVSQAPRRAIPGVAFTR
jgi:hypothetical protein